MLTFGALSVFIKIKSRYGINHNSIHYLKTLSIINELCELYANIKKRLD
jgi:hypothetical protein